ncbi:replicative DNA helicase [Rhodocaloribacter litoris]|uniref:replicative DNA helicase n=1 Tax=Rhodocaloribacter litoris TaxID=2558931 RepID=UPI0014242602|nr:replicative DNA helicase [Rhodocaloribacter litoris]QXD13776.1 replicative DNA helicase [Rhodocaloribacter litoris]
MADHEDLPQRPFNIDDEGQPYPLEKLMRGGRRHRAEAASPGGRVPPQAVDVEQSVLGAMLIEREAIPRAIEILPPDAFYSAKHQKIYLAILSLFERGNPVDLITLTEELRRRGELDDVGGAYYISELTTKVASAANVEYHARIIAEKSLLRKMIETMTGLIGRGYDPGADAFELLDQAEAEIFRISDTQLRRAAASMNEVLKETLAQLEAIHGREGGITGVPSGFTRLDEMTGGWQKSDLIIIAARPSMGKCLAYDSEILLEDGSLVTIEALYRRRRARLLTLHANGRFGFTEPSAYVDDGLKPVFRVRTRLGRSIETTLTHPFLTIEGWKPLSALRVGDHVAVPRRLDVFGSVTLPAHRVKLLAYLIGDGCLTKTCPEFTNGNPALREDFARAVEAFGGLTTTVSTSGGRRTSTLRVASDAAATIRNRRAFARTLTSMLQDHPAGTADVAGAVGVTRRAVEEWQAGTPAPRAAPFERFCDALDVPAATLAPEGHAAMSRSSQNALTRWLQALGLWGCSAHTKHIPAVVFTLQKPLVALFLNRLFATDGWATVLRSGQPQLGYATASERLARQVQHLLLRFGIIARLKERRVKYRAGRRTAWQLDITDARSIETFVREIGMFGKEEALACVREALRGRRYQTNRDLVPVGVWEQLRAAKGAASWQALGQKAGLRGYTNLHVGKRALSRDRLRRLAGALDHAGLKNLAESEVYWDEIVAIEAVGVKQVYDLTIPETHNFVANDICVHNTAFSLACARNAALHPTMGTGVAIFSLEMSAQQLAQRLLTSEARVDAQAARTGRLSEDDWPRLARAAGRLSAAPIFIDDTPGLSILELRAKCRRLKAEHDIGLVIVDYLQLMHGTNLSRSANREQEIAQISRSLKSLAKELDVPVIALSQLSRAVETRGGDKRPQLSDLRESGCLTGDTLVTRADTGRRVPLRDLVERYPHGGFDVWAVDPATLKLVRAPVSRAFPTGVKPVYKITTRLGRTIRATANHKFLTVEGWKRLDALSPEEHLALPRHVAQPERSGQASLHTHEANTNRDVIPRSVWQALVVPAMKRAGLTTRQMQARLGHQYCGTALYQTNLSRDRARRVAAVVGAGLLARLAESDLYWDQIVSIEPDGVEEVFDLTVPGPHNFVANDIVVHNSIEQDADVVMFIYRPERYGITVDEHGNSTEGLAEIIIGKQRNGPIGDVRLAFVKHFARFENLTMHYTPDGHDDAGLGRGDGFGAPPIPPDDEAPF